MMKTMDEQEVERGLQRLADGELTAAERGELLWNLDSLYPARWRDLGLAMVERQVLAEGFAAAPEGDVQGRIIEADFAPAERRGGGRWLAAAALFALAGLIAWQLRSGPADPAGGVGGSVAASSEGAEGMVLDEQARGELLAQLEAGIPDVAPVAEALRPFGMTTEAETGFYTAELEGGRRLVVPITTFTVAPAATRPISNRE